MAIATSSWTISANTNWITSTGWVSSDPSFRLHQELNTWVTGIGSTSIINIQATPNDATSKSSNNGVAWFLQTRDGDTGSDWGIIFHPRRSDTNSGNTAQSTPLTSSGLTYYNRTPGTSNNGYGSYSHNANGGENSGAEELSVTGRTFVAYESSGPFPWFIYGWERTDLATRLVRALIRLDTSDLESGSYYPASGISKWISISLGGGSISVTRYRIPIRDVGSPQKGLFLSGYKNLDYPAPNSNAFAAGYFFRPYPQYGDVHYLGKIPNDIILMSNTSTGVWGDTITINSITYTCLGNYNDPNSEKPFDLWVRTSN